MRKVTNKVFSQVIREVGLSGLAVAEKSRSWSSDATGRTRRCAGAQVSGVRRTYEAGVQRGPEEASCVLVLRQSPMQGREMGSTRVVD